MSKTTVFADNNLNEDQMLEYTFFGLKREENAYTSIFSFSHYVFRALKFRIV